jgi:hypothetical protein
MTMRANAPNAQRRMERPNTVSGLQAKRAELAKLREALEAEVRKVTCDLDHLDAAIRLFDPATTPAAIRRYVIRYRAKKGTVKRFVLGALRGATAPLTSKAITEAWVADRGLRTDDATMVVLRKRVGACLIALRRDKLVVNEGAIGDLKGWRIA